MEPRTANVAKAAAMLGAMGVPDGDGVSSEGVTKEVRATEEELDAQEVLHRGERSTQIRDPNKTVQRERDVMGRFEADGTPKKAAAKTTREVKPMARAGTKTSPDAAEGAGEPPKVAKERTTQEGEKPADAPKTRAEIAREKLAELRASRKNAAVRAQNEKGATDYAAEQARLKAEREQWQSQTAAERARWEAARKDPIAGFAELGLDPSQAFLELAAAAKRANTPEAKIEALEAMMAQRDKEFRAFVERSETEKQERAEAAELAQARTEFLAHVADKKTHQYAHAYLAAEAKKQGESREELWIRAAGHIADQQRASGKTPSYKSIADEIEEYAKEVVLEMLAELPPEFGSDVEKAAPRKPSDAPTVPAESKGKKSTTIGNEMVSTRLSNNNRRLSMAERQKKAEKFFA